MATRKLMLIALPAILLVGCAQPNIWEPPPGGSEAQFHRDKLECAITARAAVGDSFAFGAPLFVAIAQAENNKAKFAANTECMLGKGYTLVKPGHV